MPARYFEQTLPDSSTRFRMVHIPGGTFLMGSVEGTPEATDREFPQHEVTLADFWMGEYPVTQALWEAVMGDNPSYFKDRMRPVEQVSWFDAAVFCNRLSILAGFTPAYLTPAGDVYGLSADGAWTLPNEGAVRRDAHADGYRLPTEAEWEYAARGGPYWIAAPYGSEKELQNADSGGTYHAAGYTYAGSDLLDQAGWFSDNGDFQTRQVGMLIPNTLGLYDLSGNVWEWCQDWYSTYDPGAHNNPSGPGGGSVRVRRGGSWYGGPQGCRVADRSYGAPGVRYSNTGFRLARTY